MNGSYPVVVVLMATYNGEKYLQEQIESILSQEKVNLRLVVRDDSSTDETEKILNMYKNQGKLEWYRGEHLGVEKNFLDLLKKAPEADYYAFCDQDDVWNHEKLKVAISFLERMDSDKPGVYYSSLKLVDANLKPITVHSVNRGRSDFAKFIYPGVAGCTMVFNNALKAACNQYDPQYIRMHDIWVFDVCVALGGNYYADEQSYINYRQHGNNTVGIRKNTWRESYQNYVINSKIEKHIQALLDGYEMQMTKEYNYLCRQLVTSNHSIVSRFRLIFSKKIRFNNIGLDIVFRLKAILKKM